MSSIPGYSLEDYVAWEMRIVVDGQDDPNISLQMAEMLGNIPLRPRVPERSFKEIIATYFEQYRDQVEYKLHSYDESTQSWRDYAGYAFMFIDDDVWNAAFASLEKHIDNKGM